MVLINISKELLDKNHCSTQAEYLNIKAKEFYEYLIERCQKGKIEKLCNWYKNNMVIDNIQYTFEKIVTADFDILKRIYQYLKSHEDYKKRLELPIDVKKYILSTLLEGNHIDRQKLVNDLNLTVCPYCNRNYINNAKQQIAGELDHFFSKYEYTFLAVSFFNLMPVCSTCNRLKGSKPIGMSPYDTTYNMMDGLKFDYHIKNTDFLTNPDDIKIIIRCKTEIKDNVNLLDLEERYQIHKDIVQEIEKKKYIYNESLKRELLKLYKEIFSNEDEIERIVFGNYVKPSDFHKRPLAKLTHDIMNNSSKI